ncbi:MAG TPA: GtrA family protein, partial [Sphingomicrobium sp.]|nr:GtrA family protein [Sphingomicrobium sp.]
IGGQAIYYGLAESRLTSPLLAIAIAWITGVIVGYFAHGWVSFRGHGERDDHARIGSRFVAVNAFGYVLNSFWVWFLVERLDGPTWWPIVPNIVLTPLLTFALHRRWTYA